MKLACSSQIAPGESFLEKFNSMAKFGFDGMEIRLLAEEDLQAKINEILKASKDTGIKPSSLLMPSEAFRRPLVDQEALEAKIEHVKKAAWVAGQLNCPTLICPEYGYQNPLPLFSSPKRYSDYEWKLFLELISSAEVAAKKYDTIVLLEPINRYETHYNHRLEDAVELIKIAGTERIKILADFFHMNIEEASITDAIMNAGSYIGHVHLGDNNRLLPGQGSTDFTSGFKALQKVGYQGFLALECIIPENLDIELSECVRFLRQCILESK